MFSADPAQMMERMWLMWLIAIWRCMMKKKMVWWWRERWYLDVCEIFDLWKAYSLWIESALWILLERYWTGGAWNVAGFEWDGWAQGEKKRGNEWRMDVSKSGTIVGVKGKMKERVRWRRGWDEGEGERKERVRWRRGWDDGEGEMKEKVRWRRRWDGREFKTPTICSSRPRLWWANGRRIMRIKRMCLSLAQKMGMTVECRGAGLERMKSQRTGLKELEISDGEGQVS